MGRPAKTPNDELDKFLLRMPNGLRDRIKATADKNNRSMNAEINATLEEAYPANEFSFSDFMENWVVPILRSSPEERERLISLANDFLLVHEQDMEVAKSRNKDGSIGIVLTLGSTRFSVGDATELILIGEN